MSQLAALKRHLTPVPYPHKNSPFANGAMVADENSNIPSPFDVRTIKYLVGLMSRHDLSEIDLREGELRIRLRRGGRPVPMTTVNATPPVVAPPGAPAPTVPIADSEKSAKPQSVVKSPTPGTFYSSPSPDAEPFVKVGSRVSSTTVVGIIEAMKIFTEIQAECTGVVTEILVENQQPVEYGQVLLKVDPSV